MRQKNMLLQAVSMVFFLVIVAAGPVFGLGPPPGSGSVGDALNNAGNAVTNTVNSAPKPPGGSNFSDAVGSWLNAAGEALDDAGNTISIIGDNTKNFKGFQQMNPKPNCYRDPAKLAGHDSCRDQSANAAYSSLKTCLASCGQYPYNNFSGPLGKAFKDERNFWDACADFRNGSFLKCAEGLKPRQTSFCETNACTDKLNFYLDAVKKCTGPVPLTPEQKMKIEAAQKEIKTKMQAAMAELKRLTDKRVAELNKALADKRHSRNNKQKSELKAWLAKKSVSKEPAQGQKVKAQTAQKSTVKSSLTQQTPTITELNQSWGEPGMPIIITGSGFTSGVEVYFIIGKDRTEKASVGFSTETQLMVDVPTPTGGNASPYNGLVYVKLPDGQPSAGKPFRYMPITVVQKYEFPPQDIMNTDDYVLFDPKNDKSSDFEHKAGVWTYWPEHGGDKERAKINHSIMGPIPFKSQDIVFPKTRLKNGWVVEDVLLNDGSMPFWWKVKLEDSGKGTDVLKLKFKGDVVAPAYGFVQVVEYVFSILIRGPEGVPYK